jgi:AP-1 complex subunit mu
MVVSAVFFIDLKGKVLISRNYRGDVTRVQAERFAQKVQETDPTELKPVFVDAGVTYMYLQVCRETWWGEMWVGWR